MSKIISNPEQITILFHGGITKLCISTNTEKDLTCRHVLLQCIKHIVKHALNTEKDVKEAMSLPVFGLVTCPEEKIWLSHTHVFKKRSEKERTYKFRVRFRLPSDKLGENMMSEYLFLQTRDDFLMGSLGKNEKLDENILFGCLVIAFIFPDNLPLDNKCKVDKTLKTCNFSLWNFTRKISKEIARHFIAQRLVDHFWVYQALKKGIRHYKNMEPPCTLGYLKKRFYETLMKEVPSYCIEEYKAISIGTYSEKNEEVTVNVAAYNMGMNEPALYYCEVRKCSLRDIYAIKLTRPRNSETKSWSVAIIIASDPPKTLEFDDEGAAESFISMVEGYMHLFICYNICVNIEFQTHEAKISSELQSFGPLSYETAADYLDDSKGITDSCRTVYLIHESLTQFGHYVVMWKAASDQDKKTYDIKYISDTFFLLTPEREFIFNSPRDLRTHLREYGQQIHPRNYSILAEINYEFGMLLEEYGASPAICRPENESEVPLPVIKDDLTDMKYIEDMNPLVQKYSVKLNAETFMLVEVQSTKGKEAKAFREGLERLLKLNRIRPNSFLKFYNMVVDSKLSFLTELPPKGDLLTYICRGKNTVAQKLHIMFQIVKILSVMQSHNYYHGNIRSRRFLVFNGEESNFVTIKLGDPGISTYFDTQPLEDVNNMERIAWLSPERWQDLSDIRYESECFAVGTTLYELLIRNDQFHDELKLPRDKTVLQYLKENGYLPKPPILKETSNTEDDHALLPEARNVLEAVWEIILKCWAKDKFERPNIATLMTDLNELQMKASEIVGDTKLEKLKKVVYIVKPQEQDAVKGDNLTSQDLQKQLKKVTDERYIMPNCIKMNGYKDNLGQGHFGAAWKGEMRCPRQNSQLKEGEWKAVAVKRMFKDKKFDERMFWREILLACEFEHQNIVRVLGVGVELTDCQYSQYMLVMEFMDKGNLTSYASSYGHLDSPEKVDQMLKICWDIAEGMVYLSGKSIVHRDLAARNILLCIQNGIIVGKVSDFGLARVMEDNYRFYRVKKTETLPFIWMPPECLDLDADGFCKFTSAGDVWSFGIVVWEGLTQGQHPRNYMPPDVNKKWTQEQLLVKYQEGNGWRLPRGTIDQEVYDLMMQCWQMDQKKRPAFVDIVQKLKILRVRIASRK